MGIIIAIQRLHMTLVLIVCLDAGGTVQMKLFSKEDMGAE
jgi:hypothetical protein